MKRSFSAVLGLCGLAVLGAGACSSKTPAPTGPTVEPGKFLLEVFCDDKDDDIYADPGALPEAKGTIIKCAKGKELSAAELMAGLPKYTGKPLTSGARVYRVLYRTERGDAAQSPGTSSALVYIPTTPRAATLPVVVVSHATRGQGPKCAASKLEEIYQVGPLVGAGFAVIAPDLAGYANYGAPGNPGNVYAGAVDVGKSTLDGAKALRKMISTSVSDKVIITGHSQGGGTALGALATSATYDAGGTIAGVVAFAPLWVAQTSWGALPLLASTYTFEKSSLINSVAIWYMYSHGEMYDGPGHGGDIFKPEKRAAIKDFVDNVCLDAAGPALLKMGSDITDVYDPEFAAAVKAPAGLGGGCSGELCTKWLTRFAADRPHFEGATAAVPILIPYGGGDMAIPGDRMACVLDRLETDKAQYKLCLSPGVSHEDIVGARSGYAADWIAARTLGEAEPAACPDAFMKPACATPPPND